MVTPTIQRMLPISSPFNFPHSHADTPSCASDNLIATSINLTEEKRGNV